MTQIDPPAAPQPWPKRGIAFAVHLLTAIGAGLALMATLEAAREHWSMMFLWLGIALLVDAVDGPIARGLAVRERLPNWSGDTLDLVVDFTTYVFVPAFAMVASGLLVKHFAPLVAIAVVMSGALYFADLRMKLDDNRFRGFPTLWNIALFYLFLLRPEPWLASFAMLALVVATFLPIPFMHPLRVKRWRGFNIALIGGGGALAAWTILHDFDVPPLVKLLLGLIGGYVVLIDPAIQLLVRQRKD